MFARPAKVFSLDIVKDGKPAATIVVADKPTVSVETALKDLNDHIQQITGTNLPVAKTGEAVSGPVLLLGPSPLLEKYGVKPDTLKNDEWLIKSGKDYLAIAGRDGDDSRRAIYSSCIGTYNGMIAFLEDYCGGRHYMPGKLGTIIPKIPTLTIPDDLNIQGQKDILWGGSRFGGNTLAMRWLWRGAPGLKIHSAGGHSWEPAIPVTNYFKTHPEYFALVSGKRNNNPESSLCVVNPEVLKLKIEWAKEQLKDNDVVEIGQPDSYGNGCPACECEKCAALGAGERLGDRVYWFHKQVAEAIQAWNPAKKLLIIAYGPSYYPRSNWKFPSNVIIEICNLKTIETAPEGFVPWSKVHNQFSVYVYFWLAFYKDGYAPHSSQKIIRDAFALFKKHGVTIVYYCGTPMNWGLEAPQYYLDYLLRMNFDADLDKALNEFYTQFYGPAAATMRAFFEVIEEAQATPIAKGKDTSEFFYIIRWPKERTGRALKLLDEALAKAGDDPVFKTRIELSRPAMEYLELTTEVFQYNRQYRSKAALPDLETLAQVVQKRQVFVEELARKQDSGYYNNLGLPDPFYSWDRKIPLRDQLGLGKGTGLRGPFDIDFSNMLSFVRSHGVIRTKAMRSAVPVKLDGVPDDAIWQKATKLGAFENMKGAAPNVPTDIQIAYDDQAFYAAWTVHEPAVDKMEAKPFLAITKGKPYYEDCVELFLGDAAEGSRKYCHFIASFTNSRYDGRAGFISDELDPAYYTEDERWQGEWQSAAHIDKDKKQWIVEIAVPWSTLGFMEPKPGNLVRVNFCRERWTEKQSKNEPDLTSWSPTFSGFQDHTRFGVVELGE